MKNGYLILSTAAIIPLLSSCGAFQNTADNEGLSIKPVFNVRHSTGTPENFYQLGRYYQGQNRQEQALAAYQKALDIDGTFADARNGLGVIYTMQRKQQEALEQFRLAAKQAPNAAHIYNNLGYALYLSGSYAEAASVLERAVALQPSNKTAHTNLALALDKAGDREKAVQVMAQAAMQQPAENVPPHQEAPQAQTGASTPTPISAQTVAPKDIPAPAPQQASLALPKDWGVITQAAPKQVPLVESSTQAVQLAPNVYELRERAGVQEQEASAAKPPAQAAVPAAKPYRIEVSNGNGVTGMARKVAGFLDGKGYSGARLTNQKPFQVATSQVQYRSGYREQAQSLVLALPGQPGIAQSQALRGDISVRVVLGKDVAGNVAYFEKNQDKIRLVRN